MNYYGTTYDHRVQCAFKHNDAIIGINMLTNPPTLMIDNVVQVTTLRDDSKMRREVQNVIDKDGEDYFTNQIELKQYICDIAKYRHNLEKYFGIILGQCDPAMEQSLIEQDNFTTIKSSSDSIALMKMLEMICYNYQFHEYPPLGACDAMDLLSKPYQSDGVSKAKHHKLFKTIMDVCKASGINFMSCVVPIST